MDPSRAFSSHQKKKEEIKNKKVATICNHNRKPSKRSLEVFWSLVHKRTLLPAAVQSSLKWAILKNDSSSFIIELEANKSPCALPFLLCLVLLWSYLLSGNATNISHSEGELLQEGPTGKGPGGWKPSQDQCRRWT